MKLIVTKHAQQRRPHYKIISIDELKELMMKLIDHFDIENMKDEVYKIYKNEFAAVIKKEKNNFVLITVRFYQNLDKYLSNNQLKIHHSHQAFQSNENSVIVRRYNFKGKPVKCGYVVPIYGSNDKLLVLKSGLKKKFGLEFSGAGERFNDNEEIKHLVSYNEKDGYYWLNPFERN